MNNSILSAIRAIGAEQLRRLIRLVVIVVVCCVIIFIIVIAWLSHSYSEWWLVFALPLVIIVGIIALILAVLWAITTLISPRVLSKNERQQIRRFTDQLYVAAARAQLSRSAMAFLIIKDALRGKRLDDRIGKVIDEGKGLKRAFEDIQRMF